MPKTKLAVKEKSPQKVLPVIQPDKKDLKEFLGPGRDARLAREALGSPSRIILPRPPIATIKSLIAKTGLDVAALGPFAAKRRADARKIAAERWRTGVAQSASLHAYLESGVDAWRNASRLRSGLLPLSKYLAIDRPSQISLTSGLTFDHIRKGAYNSWVKLKYQRSSSGFSQEEVSFLYFFQNSPDLDLVMSVYGFISLNGLARADDTTGFWLTDHSATTLNLTVELRIYNWSDNREYAVNGTGPTQALALNAYGEGWPESVGAIALQNVFRGFELDVQEVLVPKGKVMLFEVVLRIGSSIDDGDVSLDFSTNDFQVMSPFVQMNVTS